ncbi:MAG: TlpA disulfide reductase family protein [Ferruginibacter sp.]
MKLRHLLLASVLIFTMHTAQSQEIKSWKLVDLKEYMDTSRGVTVINFWATFCKPCVAEIPSFINLVEKYRGQVVTLMLVSLDLPSYYPAKIAAFASSHKFNVPIAWLNETNADFFCPIVDKSWSGSIPATLIMNKNTGYRKFYEGELSQEEFLDALKQAGISQ